MAKLILFAGIALLAVSLAPQLAMVFVYSPESLGAMSDAELVQAAASMRMQLRTYGIPLLLLGLLLRMLRPAPDGRQ